MDIPAYLSKRDQQKYLILLFELQRRFYAKNILTLRELILVRTNFGEIGEAVVNSPNLVLAKIYVYGHSPNLVLAKINFYSHSPKFVLAKFNFFRSFVNLKPVFCLNAPKKGLKEMI